MTAIRGLAFLVLNALAEEPRDGPELWRAVAAHASRRPRVAALYGTLAALTAEGLVECAGKYRLTLAGRAAAAERRTPARFTREEPA